MLTECINSDPGEWCGDHEDVRRRAREALQQSIIREWQGEDQLNHHQPLWAVAVVWWWLELTCAAADVRRRATDLRRRVAAWVRPRIRVTL